PNEALAQSSREPARLGRRRAGFNRATLGAPSRQAAVEHGDRVVAEGAKRPPDTRGADDAARVVDDHAIAIANAELPDLVREVRRARQHVRPRGARFGELADGGG